MKLLSEKSNLIQAVKNGDLLLVKGILTGDDVSSIDNGGRTLLHFACRNGHLAVIQFLLEQGGACMLNATDLHLGFTPLHDAIFSRHLPAVRQLLDAGANTESEDYLGLTPFYYLSMFRDIDFEMISLMLARGAKIDCHDNEQKTPLYRASCRGDTALIIYLLEKGALIDSKDEEGRTPLLRAVQKRQSESVRLLLDRGANMHEPSNSQVTPFLCAFAIGNLDAIYWMIRLRPEVWEKVFKLIE